MRKLLIPKSVFKVLLVSIVTLGIQNVNAGDRTVETLTNENVTLSEAGELHLTSSTEPISNSTINITNADSWVFFDNIKPSVVKANYANAITINGMALADGTNARVGIFLHGTVVMPHSSTFKPLTVFTGENLTGNSTKMAIETYYNKLNEFDNAIKSFRLKRGYMVTLANEASGKGYSRVFIADKSDLIVDNLQDELNGSVSFIRVFKWNWVTKKGWCGWNWDEYQMVNATWYYDWSAGGNSSNNVEYSVIKQNLGWPGWASINSKKNISHLLGYNEPDHTEQSDVTVDEAIAAWPEFMESGLRLGAPATTDFNWVIEFCRRCDELNYRVDFVAVHSYWGNDPSSYLSSLKWVHEATGRPLWITEWNYGANWTNEWWPDSDHSYTDSNADYAYNKIKAIVDFFDDTPWIERYSIYNWVQDCRAIVLNNVLTKAGQYYADNNSVEAYNPNYEVVPHWNYTNPELGYKYSTSTNKVTLEWTDGNGELSKGYKIERKISDGDFEEIDYILNDEEYAYEDSVSYAAMGNVTYRISAKTNTGDFLGSNEVSVYLTGNEGDIEVGQFDVKGDDWNYCLFSQKQNTIPQVILGVPSYNNRSVVLSQRVYGTSTTNCRFKLFPFDYINKEIDAYESFPLMAIPAGVYNFNGMEVQAKAATSIKGDWKSFTFSEPFSTTPVVFLTQTSNYNDFSLAAKVRNVTNTGFEVKLQSEESNTAYISSEKMSYVAVTPGEGYIGTKRVVVGTGEVGDFYSTHEITFDEDFVSPVVFAGVQTSNDEIASTLRYYQSASDRVKLFKKRETSASTTKVSKDQLGYMVVDISNNQPGVNAISNSFLESYSVYPNPTVGVLNIDIDESKHIEIFDMLGALKMVAEANGSIDISELKAGNYTLKVEGMVPQVITKW